MADKILIVDDEPEIADLVSLYLQNENFIVFKFYNAADALKCVQSETDYFTPRDPGLSFAQTH